MLQKKIVFKHRKIIKEIEVAIPDSVEEIIALCDEREIVDYFLVGYLAATRRAAFEMRKKPKLVKIDVNALSQAQRVALENAGILPVLRSQT